MAFRVSTRRSAGMIAAAAPVLAVIAIRWMAGSQPLSASADSMQMQTLPTTTMLTPRLTARQQEVKEFAFKALDRPFGASPMSHGQLTPDVIEEATKRKQSLESGVVQASVPVFDVTSILVGARHQLATINGKLFRIGDEIAPGWRLESIDAVQSVVVIVSKTGVSVDAPVRRRNR